MFFQFTAALALSVLSVFASSTPTQTKTYKSLNPTHIQPFHKNAIPQVLAMTNAERLRRGLNPNTPNRLHVRKHIARTAPSSTPSTSVTGILEIADANTGNFVAYVSKTWNDYGEYFGSTDIDDALSVTIDTSTTGPVSIKTLNGPDVDYPYFGAISGFASDSVDFSSGTDSYAYLGGVISTAPNSPPVDEDNSFSQATSIGEPIESSIFTYDPTTQFISAQWVNSDSSLPSSSFALSQDLLVLIGDYGTFVDSFGNAELVNIRLVTSL